MRAVEAVSFFRELSQDPALHNDMPHTGCFIRARQICRRLEHDGDEAVVVRVSAANQMMTGRVSCLEDDGSYSSHDVNWGFHVAAAAPVVNPDGQEQLLVFDPALFDGPVSVDSWSRAMCAGGKNLGTENVQKIPYRQGGDRLLADIEKSVGLTTDEAFFATRSDRFAGKKIVRRPSPCQRNYYRVLEAALSHGRG